MGDCLLDKSFREPNLQIPDGEYRKADESSLMLQKLESVMLGMFRDVAQFLLLRPLLLKEKRLMF